MIVDEHVPKYGGLRGHALRLSFLHGVNALLAYSNDDETLQQAAQGLAECGQCNAAYFVCSTFAISEKITKRYQYWFNFDPKVPALASTMDHDNDPTLENVLCRLYMPQLWNRLCHVSMPHQPTETRPGPERCARLASAVVNRRAACGVPKSRIINGVGEVTDSTDDMSESPVARDSEVIFDNHVWVELVSNVNYLGRRSR